MVRLISPAWAFNPYRTGAFNDSSPTYLNLGGRKAKFLWIPAVGGAMVELSDGKQTIIQNARQMVFLEGVNEE